MGGASQPGCHITRSDRARFGDGVYGPVFREIADFLYGDGRHGPSLFRNCLVLWA